MVRMGCSLFQHASARHVEIHQDGGGAALGQRTDAEFSGQRGPGENAKGSDEF